MIRSDTLVAAAMILASLSLSGPTQAKSTRDIYMESRDSVVLIISYDEEGIPSALGSGFFFTESEVVTNYHVIKGAARIVLKNSGAGLQTEAVGISRYSEYLDLAVLEVEDGTRPLPVAASSGLGVGEKVIAIGNPRGLEGTVSEGIVSATRPVDDFVILQITAPISPGSSGGPLLNSAGQVVGITTATISDGQNLNFAMPAGLLPRLERGGQWEPSSRPLKANEETGNAGIALSDFAKRNQHNSEISFTLRNTNDYAVRNIVFLLMYYNVRTRGLIHFSVFTEESVVPSGLAKRFKKEDDKLEGLSTDRQFLQEHLQQFADAVISAELRVLSYDIVEEQRNDALMDALEGLN